MNLFGKRKRDPDKELQRQDACPAHRWSQPRPYTAFWLKSYWVSRCRRCGATIGRATEQELREALPNYPKGTHVEAKGTHVKANG
ncbi:MAG: hypothetical protein WBV77_14735 [Solirubrobacteraceae bacterium]